jgi:hypothetical protein
VEDGQRLGNLWNFIITKEKKDAKKEKAGEYRSRPLTAFVSIKSGTIALFLCNFKRKSVAFGANQDKSAPKVKVNSGLRTRSTQSFQYESTSCDVEKKGDEGGKVVTSTEQIETCYFQSSAKLCNDKLILFRLWKYAI